MSLRPLGWLCCAHDWVLSSPAGLMPAQDFDWPVSHATTSVRSHLVPFNPILGEAFQAIWQACTYL